MRSRAALGQRQHSLHKLAGWASAVSDLVESQESLFIRSNTYYSYLGYSLEVYTV